MAKEVAAEDQRVTEETSRPATQNDLITLIKSLSMHGVDYVLIGGQALNIHGYMRATEDIDLLLPLNYINGRKVIDALSILPDKAALEIDPEWLTEKGTVRVNDVITVDLMTVAANGETYESLKAHILEQELQGFSIRLLDLEGLAKTKVSVREKDRMDLQIIHRLIEAESQKKQDTDPDISDKLGR
jgi:hypothetical protein